jgi:hypothetical protein
MRASRNGGMLIAWRGGGGTEELDTLAPVLIHTPGAECANLP